MPQGCRAIANGLPRSNDRFAYNQWPRDACCGVAFELAWHAIEGDFWHGHHYEMFRMAETFRQMVRTKKEPTPHQEILEVTAIIHAGVKSLKEKSRLVDLKEVMG